MDNKEAILMLKLICGYAISHEKLCTESDKILEAVHKAIIALKSDPNAPDWSQAPDWAGWMGVNADGQKTWFEKKPNLTYHGFHSTSGKRQFDFREDWVKLWQRPAE